MAVLDRMHHRMAQQKGQTAEGSPATSLSTIRAAAKPEVIQRLEFVVTSLHNYIRENDDSGTMARFSYVTQAMIEEVSEELADRDEETLQYFMSQMGEVIAWIGHGDKSRLPDNMRAFVEARPQVEAAS
jgi:site-specific recombinase